MFGWIPFAFGAVLLVWAVVSFTHAASGGGSSGLHQTAARAGVLGGAELARRRAQRFRLHQAMNFALALGVLAAAVGLVVGARVY